MNQVIEDRDARIDTIDQPILLSLEDAGEPKSVAQIKSEIGERRQSVYYRLVERAPSLTDLGLVACDEDSPSYYLTIEGQFTVESNRETFEAPKSFAKIQSEVCEAKQEAESAKDSVQSYRKKVSRTKDTAEAAADRVEEIKEDAVTDDELQRRMMQIQNELLESIDARVQQITLDLQ